MKIKDFIPANTIDYFDPDTIDCDPNNKYTYSFVLTGVKKTDPTTNRTYYHFMGRKYLKLPSRLKNFGKACVLTVVTFGLGILFSPYIRRCWTKALIGRVSYNYLVSKDKFSGWEEYFVICRAGLTEAIKKNGLNDPIIHGSGLDQIITENDPELINEANSEGFL